MAEGTSSQDKILKTLKDELTCPLCLDIFEDPKRLPCEHVFCRQCLHSLALRSISGSISCPECRRNIPVPNHDVSIFSTPHQINRLKETYEKNLGTDHAAPQPVTCKIHNSQTLELYCETCEKLVCRDCVISSCTKKNHEYGYIDDMVEKYRTVLGRELKPIKALHQQLSSALEVISTAERELKNKREEKLRRVETTFDALSEILTRERRYFTEAIENSFQEQNGNYSSKKSEIQDEVSKLSSLIQSIEISSQNDPKEVFLANVTQKKQTIKHAKGVATNLSPDPVKVPEKEMNLLDPTEFNDLCHLKNFVYQSEDPLKSRFDRSVALRNKCVPMMEPFKVNVFLAPNSGRKYFGRAKKIVSQLECTYENYSQKVNVEQISSEKYSLSVTPQKRGNHKLHIKCDGAHICGSPIPVYVSVDPKEIVAFSKPEVLDLRNPGGIKYHDHKLYVIEDEEELLIFETPYMRPMKMLKLPGVGEVLVEEGYLYYTDTVQDRLVKANLNGTIISSIGTLGDKPGQFNFPNGIKLSKNGEIFVCDSRNKRIQVFDRDLKLLRIIRANFHFPADLDFDEAGNIYVVEIYNHRVQVLTPQGQHIRNIGQYGSGKGELHRPVSAAIHRDMVYVTDGVNKRISVFTTMGEFITTFGEGIVTRPECIAIDDNGHIFVTDNRMYVVKF